jgi:hypothetical protein
MSESEDLKAEIKKWSNAALKAKMDLHDLSEDLPLGWEKIPEVARIAHEAYKNLEARRESLKVLA